ncbi:MAG TPA: D-alanine--D-alanine ligase [Candidatus Saccharimonadales bacterium]|nr:D-alanine--D-alanine ligase [Candidatus Saccharimonadales bacterium]
MTDNTQSSKQKVRVGIFFGGQSAEHEVSLQSAKNVVEALDKAKFEPVLIGIDKQGQWHLQDSFKLLEEGRTFDRTALETKGSDGVVTFLPGSQTRELVDSGSGRHDKPIDVAFPVLHGPRGEDGTIQGFFELANVPYVGSGVLGSAVGMDKDVMKRLLRDASVPITDFVALHDVDRHEIDLDGLIDRFGLPMFVKPANMGSSIGVSRATDKATLQKAIDDAFQFDQKILIEKTIEGDEIECSVLGNEKPRASTVGRVIPKDNFYSYDAKYLDDEAAKLEIPAKIPEAVVKKAQKTAVEAFKVLGCEGMARVDMFATKDGQILVNEVNTIPGFTMISMYPKLWEASGLSYSDLITELINLAIERFKKRNSLKKSLH